MTQYTKFNGDAPNPVCHPPRGPQACVSSIPQLLLAERTLLWRTAVGSLLLLVLSPGCNRDVANQSIDGPNAVTDNRPNTPPQSSQPAASPVQSPEASELEAAGARLDYDAKQGSLTSVDCSQLEVTDGLAAKLATFGQLKKLTIRPSSMSDEGWQTLSALHELEQLDVREAKLNSSQLASLLSGTPKLRALRMSGKTGDTEVDDSGLETLANCKELRVLAADHLWVSADGLEHIKGCEQLSELYLAGTLVDDPAMAFVANFPKLKKLRLAKTSIGTAGLESLSSLALEDLDISECSQVFDDSLLPIGKMSTLKRLNLWRDVISDAGVAHLSGLANMAWLNLDNTHMGNAGLVHLSGMKQLSFLHLGSTYVTNDGMPLLTPLTSLKELKVTRTSVTEEGLKPLMDVNPQVDVQIKYIEGE